LLAARQRTYVAEEKQALDNWQCQCGQHS
jgi:hypothetical protein